MLKIIRNECGFLMLNVIFLTLITSLAAMILINAAPRAHNPQSTLRLTALYLANEQFAQLESLAAAGEPLQTNFLGKPEDLITENAGKGKLTEFKVTTDLSGSNPYEVTVTVTLKEGGGNFEVKAKRTIWVAE